MQEQSIDFSPPAAVKAQQAYCDANNLPCFAPSVCFACGRPIYALEPEAKTPEQARAISVNQAGQTLITSCPFCNTSFVD
jgi:hypothetical protein